MTCQKLFSRLNILPSETDREISLFGECIGHERQDVNQLGLLSRTGQMN